MEEKHWWFLILCLLALNICIALKVSVACVVKTKVCHGVVHIVIVFENFSSL